MSSDSEDDCYGNIAQKLQTIKNKYKEDGLESNSLLDNSFRADSYTSKKVEKVIEIEDSGKKDIEVLKDDSDVEEISLDTIIANNSKKRATRSSKRNADISADNILPKRCRKISKTGKKTNDSIVENPTIVDSSNQSVNIPSGPTNTPSVSNSVNTPRGRGRPRRSCGRKTTRTASNVNITRTSSNTGHPTITTVDNVNTHAASSNIDTSSNISSILNTLRGRRSRRGRSYTPRRCRRTCLANFITSFGPSNSRQIQSYPTYNVGNFAEYPDECYNQPLFNNQTAKKDDVIIAGENEPENDSIDENEELSVKVYWQNRECVKFTIRRFQKLTQIFDYFADKENVSHDKLLFTYNDKILKIDDTPDSITYSIVKFIDGGVINQSVSKIVQKDRSTAKGGIKLKFQCQNMKKPFETTIRSDDKMAVAMMMCSEHFEKPLDKLKFHFDGDLITGKTTPRELDLEGGECIDVKIIS